jgi:hypothetical protein
MNQELGVGQTPPLPPQPPTPPAAPLQ